jgi:RHS repeat-associated protein
MLYRYDQLNRIKTAVSSQNTYQTGYSYDANGNIKSLLRNDQSNATIDNLSYTYTTNVNNRLNKLRDNSNNNIGFTSSATPYNYQYDKIGNLIEDEEKGVSSVKWTVYGKVASVTKNDTEISYKYDATGNRIYKKVVSLSATKETHYVRDASGNLMATYENKIAKEFVIYGSSRLGIYNGNTSEGKRTLGNKKYELSNHLGNVLSVISDNKIGVDNTADFVADYYEPLIISESDYYPFGMQMASRSFQNQEYLFAFQGQESNEELGTVHYKYREADIVTGRFWSVDPLTAEYPHNSPFAFSENRVIDAIELEGLEAWQVTEQWDKNNIAAYREYVGNKTKEYIAKGNEFTCEDFALSLLISFASENNLPIILTNGSGTYDASSEKYKSIDQFKIEVFNTSGAVDVQNNSKIIEWDKVTEGSMLLLKNKEGNASHVQVVSKDATNNNVKIFILYQGNTAGALFGPLFFTADYDDFNYTGVELQEVMYNRDKDIYYNISEEKEIKNYEKSKNVVPYEWNFEQFNNNDDEEQSATSG